MQTIKKSMREHERFLRCSPPKRRLYDWISVEGCLFIIIIIYFSTCFYFFFSSTYRGNVADPTEGDLLQPTIIRVI